MIERYCTENMKWLWEPKNKLKKWLEVELAVCEALANKNEIPMEDFQQIKERSLNFPSDENVRRIDELERKVKHDVIAFLQHLEEIIGPSARYIHMGLTSSDILDTSYNLLLRDAADLLLVNLDQLLITLKEQAIKHKITPMIGRSHGVHAEPISLGLVFANWFAELLRGRRRLQRARENINFGKLSGAVGTFANISPSTEEAICKRLGLKPEVISSQIIQRDHHAEFFTTLAIIASSIEKFAVEIRHFQQTELCEVEEPFSLGQKGSSAMPHKRNPILCENICGLARIVRSHSMVALENIALWYQRDISHSSAERVIGPDSTILLDFMLARFTYVMKNINVYPENMQANLNLSQGLIFSQQVLMVLTKNGMARQKAYQLVQTEAMRVKERGINFKEALLKNDNVMAKVSPQEIEDCFDLRFHLKYVDNIFNRVFKIY